MTISIQASTSCDQYNESSPLVTFNERADTTTYTPDHTYQKSLQENMVLIEKNIKNLHKLPFNDKAVYVERARNAPAREQRMWAKIESKRTTDYPFLLQQQKEIKSLKNEINYNKKIIHMMMIGLAGTTVTSLYLAYMCSCNEK